MPDNETEAIFCIEPGCTNRSDEGEFAAEYCLPCARYYEGGDGTYSQAYRNALAQQMKRTEIEKTIFHYISIERTRQHDKWGEQNHLPENWLSILGEEYGEVCRAIYEKNYGLSSKGNYREELVQLAAVTVQMIECFDRKERRRIERESVVYKHGCAEVKSKMVQLLCYSCVLGYEYERAIANPECHYCGKTIIWAGN